MHIPADGTDTYTLDCRNIVGGYISTHNQVFEPDIFPTLFVLLHGLNVPDYSSVLSGSASLFLVCILELCTSSERLTERHFGFAGRALHIILPSHALDVNFQMEFSHTGDDRL